ncbi:MAG: hypothetical protein IT257_04235, partial [Chitinophagaceae bacterium]|nr:hypothetical protein [Chitinophagaceae bacterium]
YSAKIYAEISFNFTNGFQAAYSQWRKGQTIQVQGNHCKWTNASFANGSQDSYQLYLQKVFAFAGSLSLAKQLKPVTDISTLLAGDVWIRGGSPGHAVIVLDVATNKAGKKIFLIAQSYMPAQDIHILKNPGNELISPWYAVEDIQNELETPEYTFYKTELRRW